MAIMSRDFRPRGPNLMDDIPSPTMLFKTASAYRVWSRWHVPSLHDVQSRGSRSFEDEKDGDKSERHDLDSSRKPKDENIMYGQCDGTLHRSLPQAQE